MAKILIIIAPKDFQDMEYLVPKEIFEEAGFEVATASTKKDCLGVFGLDVTADILLNEIKTEDYEAVVLVGGGGAQVFINDPQMHQLLKEFYKSGKIVAAICLSPATLAKAGLLKGKKCTVFPDSQLIAMLRAGGPARNARERVCVAGGGEYTGNPVEQDGRIITATDPTTAKEFAETIVKNMVK